ncbi:hypothetical protein, partial [Rhizobium giardinii]|uniref:hypothetical protein n=1 Tax=Rhizobium giardinii TaxID=56731 RepID=UPI00035D572C
MGIEEFCGRFKLSVKIGIIGAAFILTIAAIGGLSFFATGVLQKRLDSSSDVVNALTGFKNVYASMTRFLQDASEDSRGELYQKLDGQKAILHTAENHLSAIDGKAVITTAASETAEIETKVEDLWEIHQSEASIRKRLERDLSSIGSLQQKIATEQLALEGSVREREQSAKQLLEHAEYLDGTSRFFQKLAADVRAASPEKIPGIANARVRFIAKQLEAHARDFSPAVATSLRDLAAALNGLSSATITPSDVISADIVSRSVRLESAIKGDAVENMRAATRIFGDLNQRSALTVAVLG